MDCGRIVLDAYSRLQSRSMPARPKPPFVLFLGQVALREAFEILVCLKYRRLTNSFWSNACCSVIEGQRRSSTVARNVPGFCQPKCRVSISCPW